MIESFISFDTHKIDAIVNMLEHLQALRNSVSGILYEYPDVVDRLQPVMRTTRNDIKTPLIKIITDEIKCMDELDTYSEFYYDIKLMEKMQDISDRMTA